MRLAPPGLSDPSQRLAHNAQVEAIFNVCLGQEHHTRLCGGAAEPLYQPAAGCSPARIWYRYDYVASAFHEVAHWCIAGYRRRQLSDYGYWYQADGRDAQAQQRFCAVEARPQAIESFFHAAWGSTFHPSFDNLDGEAVDPQPFLSALAQQQAAVQQRGLPPRAAVFAAALRQHALG